MSFHHERGQLPHLPSPKSAIGHGVSLRTSKAVVENATTTLQSNGRSDEVFLINKQAIDLRPADCRTVFTLLLFQVQEQSF